MCVFWSKGWFDKFEVELKSITKANIFFEERFGSAIWKSKGLVLALTLGDINRHIVRDLMAPIPGIDHAIDGRVIDHCIPLVLVREWYVDEFEGFFTKYYKTSN